jgi:hypothetical protein
MRLPFLQVTQEGMVRARTMARLLRIPEAHGVGLYVTLTAWALDLAPDGDLSGQLADQDPAALIAAGVGWDGDPAALLEAMLRTTLVMRVASGTHAVAGLGVYRRERRRVRVRPELEEWYAENPGVPPPSVDLAPPLVRLRTPEERAQWQAEQVILDAQRRSERQEQQRLRARRWVYFIQADTGGPIKIGISRDVERRRGELQRAERQPLKVLATFEGTIQDESAMHARFAAHRLHGEWFTPAPDLMSHIAALSGVKA